MDFLSNHLSEILSFLGGLVSGGTAGSLITFRVTRQLRLSGSGRITYQSHARAGGDIVGGDKSPSRTPR
jgi:hypothetical protein